MLHRLYLCLKSIVVSLLHFVSVYLRNLSCVELFGVWCTCSRKSTQSVLELEFERLSAAGPFKGNVIIMPMTVPRVRGQIPQYGFPFTYHGGKLSCM